MKKMIAFAFLTLYTTFTFACSTFLLSKNGHYVFGRNYDWVTGNGTVLINARGVRKSAFVPDGSKPISWTSSCGSITFNQFGKEFPHGGMNEKGLVVELMWLPGTQYPATDNRAALNELQWIQYQLDNCATVAEVLATDKVIRINRQGAAPLHYLVADASGNAATIEFVAGKMAVHTGSKLNTPVLTNTVYNEAVQQMQNGNTKDNSVARFATACNMVQAFQQVQTPPVDYAFSILDKIAQGSFTKWRIVYDITAREIQFVTTGNERKKVSFAGTNFSCSNQQIAFNINSNGSGNITTKFLPFTFAQNKTIIEQSAQESRSQIQIPQETITGAANYFNAVRCK